MQPAERADRLVSGAQIKMIGVAQQNLAADLAQVARQHRLDRPLRAHRHEAGRFDLAVGGHQTAEARPRSGITLQNREMFFHFGF